MSGYCRRDFTPPVLGRFIAICFIYHNKSGFVSASPRRQNVAYALLAEVAGDCNHKIALRINGYLTMLSAILHDIISPFLRGRWAGRGCRTTLYLSRGLD